MPASFSIRRRVQFSETDMAGIVHFSNFFRMMEEVEHAFFRSVGLSVSMQHDGMHVGWPRVSTLVRFFRAGQVRGRGRAAACASPGSGKNRSATRSTSCWKGGVMALGKTTSVCCELRPDGSMKSIPIPDELREKLSPPEPPAVQV